MLARDMINIQTQENRDLFLNALRSGQYLKGTIESDSRGKPPSDSIGYCAVGLAHILFCGDTSLGHLATMKKALGLKAYQFTQIQQEWNDSPLTFPEIADLIETEMFGRIQ